MFLHDIIKIRYVDEGYLPNHPYYLISDAEMIDAFKREDGFFDNSYPCPCDDLQEAYQLLKEAIFAKLDAYLESDKNTIPDWVYSYMLMRPVTYDSDEQDIAYLYELTGVQPETILTEFSPQLARACYATSKDWMKKRPSRYKDRPPAMFGETHVTKCLRLEQANILIDQEIV